MNRELRAIRNCYQALLHAADEQGLIEEICRIVCEEAGYGMAWVTYAEHDEANSVRPATWKAVEEGNLANIGISWANTESGRGLSETPIRTGRACCTQDFATDPPFSSWREGPLPCGFGSAVALPLKNGDADPFGSITIYSAQPDAFTPAGIRLFEELAADLAFGIVTLRSRAAREGAEQRVALLSFAFDKVSDAAFLINGEGRFEYVNDEACSVLGYSRAQLLGMSVSDVDAVMPATLWSDHWRDLKSQRSLSFERRYRTRDDRTFPVEVSANYVEYGDRAYDLALVRDITERERAVEALRQSEAYLAEAQTLSHTGSWAFDVARGQYVYASQECLRIFEVGAQQDWPSREAISRLIYPEDWGRVNREFETSVCEKVDTSSEFRIALPNGTTKHIQVVRHPVLNDAGEVLRVVGTVVDITERKRAEEERERLRELESDLAHINRVSMLGELAASIAHESTSRCPGSSAMAVPACGGWLEMCPIWRKRRKLPDGSSGTASGQVK